MHARLRDAGAGRDAAGRGARRWALDEGELDKLVEALGGGAARGVASGPSPRAPLDLKVRMLAASHSQYQRAAQRWWSGVEPAYMRRRPRRRPVYFVSSNTHAIANLVGGYARSQAASHRRVGAARRTPRGSRREVEAPLARGRRGARGAGARTTCCAASSTRTRAGRACARCATVESRAGLTHLSTPGHVDVDAQIIELGKLDPALPRSRGCACRGSSRCKQSDAVILNIDYPLGMAAYYCLSRLGQGVGELRGVYVMGKAATLNGRVGDVSLSGSCYDEHSRNTFLFRNAFTHATWRRTCGTAASSTTRARSPCAARSCRTATT